MMTQSAREGSNDLPLLATPKQVSAVMGPSEKQIRELVRAGRLAHVMIGNRVMIPRSAIEKFIAENTVILCRDETQAPAFDSSTSGAPITSAGPSEAAAASAALARQTANKLKSRSRSSSNSGTGEQARVIPLKSS
jgi:excisionase family DNA binding protein